jgi:hypothetical protein
MVASGWRSSDTSCCRQAGGGIGDVSAQARAVNRGTGEGGVERAWVYSREARRRFPTSRAVSASFAILR